MIGYILIAALLALAAMPRSDKCPVIRDMDSYEIYRRVLINKLGHDKWDPCCKVEFNGTHVPICCCTLAHCVKGSDKHCFTGSDRSLDIDKCPVIDNIYSYKAYRNLISGMFEDECCEIGSNNSMCCCTRKHCQEGSNKHCFPVNN